MQCKSAEVPFYKCMKFPVSLNKSLCVILPCDSRNIIDFQVVTVTRLHN